MMNPGAVVRCRNRFWVLLPSEAHDRYVLRPLTGTEDDAVVIHKGLAHIVGYALPFERVTAASFPLPTERDVTDAAAVRLLWNAARLTLREGATPFRSLGRISIRPRVYQFVPLLMAMRLDPVRLFIADDVGVGKTIEALLIARELFDRREIRRFCVLCPPYLCEQWAKEISEKFNLEPVVIRSGTVSQLERHLPPGRSIYEQYPVQVASIDFVKTDRNRHQFLQFCPELVIVDEVHGAAAASSGRAQQQERHALLKEIAQNRDRHLILLTATPHSGIEDAFRSLLGLLNPEFGQWNVNDLSEDQLASLARHFVQRTRADIRASWESSAPFPVREPADETYVLSHPYRDLFQRTYNFCSEIIRTGKSLEERKRRVRYWGALALLRCVMSSPAAAVAALTNRAGLVLEEVEEPELASYVFESAEDRTPDDAPTPPIEAAEKWLQDPEKTLLRKLARLAKDLQGSREDTKLQRATAIVAQLVKEGFHPIVWCRYVATAEYVAEHLREALPANVQVVCVTGRIPDDERETKIKEIDAEQPRVLVATDCLSEGLNLQEKFTAVMHYDLPWNPNRLEQREGRVDRYGQPAPRVKAVRFFGRDNPVDGAVIEVLLDKAWQIHRTLGTHAPVPEEGESVMQAVLEALFLRADYSAERQQLAFDFVGESVAALHRKWERDAEREKRNRTRFAQRALKPQEVQRELEAADAVLGDPDAVREFVLSAAQRIGLSIRSERRPEVFCVDVSQDSLTTVPDAIRLTLPARKNGRWLVSFVSPTPEGAEYVGRNHGFVAALARFLLEEALARQDEATASRCGVIRTRRVSELTTLALLRVRYLLEQPERAPLLSEQVAVLGWRGSGARHILWLDDGEALELLAQATPDANIPLREKQELVQRALADLGPWNPETGEWGKSSPIQEGMRRKIEAHAERLKEAHKRVRQAVSLRVRGLEVKPQLPPDLLGLLVLQPLVAP